MKATTVLATLMFALPCQAQKGPNPAPTPKADPSPKSETFYYHSWDDGEIKLCETYSGAPYVFFCDSAGDLEWKDSFLNLIGDNAGTGATKEESYQRAFDYATAHSKTFLVSLSEGADHKLLRRSGGDPGSTGIAPWIDPWPKPQTGIRMTLWSCAKAKRIMCTLEGREK